MCDTKQPNSPRIHFQKQNIHSTQNCIQIVFSSRVFSAWSSNLWVRGEWNIVMKNIILAKKNYTNNQTFTNEKPFHFRCFFWCVPPPPLSCTFFSVSSDFLCMTSENSHAMKCSRFQCSICQAWHLRFTLMEYNYCERLYCILFVYDCLCRPTPLARQSLENINTHNGQYVRIILNNKQKIQNRTHTLTWYLSIFGGQNPKINAVVVTKNR